MSDDEWISVRDAAKLSGYNKEHITRLIREGKIKAQKFSIVWQVSRSSLEAYIGKTEKLGTKRGPKPKL
jgi:excisionase family DNA binding protein